MSNNNSKIIKRFILVIFVVVLVAYSIYNSRILIAGPQINIISPQNGATVEESPLIRVEGTAHNIAFIDINDRKINVDENSYFNEPILLYPGYNIIKVSAKDKFERSIEKKLEIVYLVKDEKKDLEIKIDEYVDNFDIIDATSSTSTLSPTSTLEEI